MDKDNITLVEEFLVKKYNEQHYLLEDDVVTCSSQYKLSLSEIDKVCDRLLGKNISFRDSIKQSVKAEADSYTKNILQKITDNTINLCQIFCEISKSKVSLRFALVKFGNNVRYDIRNWYDNGEKPGKGLALTYEEITKLRDTVQNLDLNAIDFKKRGTYTGGKVSATIYDRICLCSEFLNKGVTWNKEVSIVDWGYGKKVDFRKWAADYSVCGKGVAVTFSEAEEIFDCINRI